MAYAQRRDRLASFVKGQGFDGILITNPINVRYLTGFTGEATYLLIAPNKTLGVSDGRFTQQLQEECPDLPVHIRPPGQKLTSAAIEQVKSLGWSKISCEGRHLSIAEFETFREGLPAAQWRPFSEAVEQFRLIKDESEVAAIQNAIRLAERAFQELRSQMKPEDTETKSHHRMEMLLREAGAESGSFPSIIAVGARAALPHAPPTSLTLSSQELILIDWGAKAQGYISDLTRTCVVSRNVSSRLRPIYEAVLAAQEAAARTARPGVPAFAVDAAARKAIEERGFEPYSHGLGHGIGLEVHEGPQMRPGIETMLLPGMVVTIEPGIYIPDWGGVRIEDDYLITPDGAKQLSSLPKDWDAMFLPL
jgi:Xaa-Pro aminopeptidase